MKKKTNNLEPSSFRDPSGHVYYQDGFVYRQVNKSYQKDLNQLVSSGLMDKLIKKSYLLEYSKQAKKLLPNGAVAIYKAKKIPFISYPYEWSFSQLRDAALLTLNIQKMALEHNMVLKDASAYNVQFLDHTPVFIDLLSFEEYMEGDPWIAYKQFCQHFLAPLLLMSKVDLELGKLLKVYIDGIPLPLASKLLPKQTYLSFSILSHIHLHAKNQNKYADSSKSNATNKISLTKFALLGIIDSLEGLIKGLNPSGQETEWGEYYTFTNYTDDSFKTKGNLVKKYLDKVNPKQVWDIGANNGEFSRLASEKGIFTVSSDYDPIAVEKNYLRAKQNKETNILPLNIDLTNPSSAIGWANIERKSFIQRGPADVVMVLALIHHLAISNNLPFSHIADFCSKIGNNLIIEFVPKSDSQVKKLLKTRKDIFGKYTQKNFELDFSKFFKLLEKKKIPGSERTLYLFKTL